ncbi:MAG: hypothetical protein JRD94_10200 [Deltaproteobacteria bacterium]|nr:hypothetical protein [Deltaproteobacteria bacterium]
MTGSLALELQIADGVLIESVRWAITGGDMEPMSGAIDTSAPGSTASVEVLGIPPDDGYTVTLEATSTDGETTCAGSAQFDVEAREVNEVHIMLRCKQAPRFGGVRVNGKLNVCAELVKVVVSPLETSVGSAIDLSSQAEDAEGDPITTMWEARVGTIADPEASATTYTCTERGSDQIRVVVSDDGFQHCMSEWTVDVKCVSDAPCASALECDDGQPCTMDGCNEGTGQCWNWALPDGSNCSPANPPAECRAGVCTPYSCSRDQDCDDRNACTDDFCDAGTGDCFSEARPDGEPCFLSGASFAVCTAGQCTEAACTSDEQCKPETQCTFQGVCDLETGACQDPIEVELGTLCERSDGSPGACIHGFCGCTEDTHCPSSGPCFVSGCFVQAGFCEGFLLPDGSDCSAANPPLAECQGGVCTSRGCTSDSDCDDRNECTDDFCNLGLGICDILARPDDEACFLPFVPFAVCTAGQCAEAACTLDEQCDGLRPCVRGMCDLATGICQDPIEVEDGTSCERPDGTPGACVAGVCGCADDSVCPEARQCRSAGVCNLEIGACEAGLPINEAGPCDYFERGPESGRCNNGICRPVCSANPCPDRNLDCVFDTCSPVDGMCTPVARPAGTSCTVEGIPGQCDGQGSCLSGPCPEPSKPINVMCANGLTPDQSPLPFTLSVLNLNGGAPLVGGSDFTADFTGVALFPQFFLNGAQGVVPGGVAVAELVELVATVQVRSGATGPDVPLGPDLAALTPGPTRLCNFPTDQQCTADADCAGGVCEDPITLVDLPISDDCEPGGVCESVLETGPGSQCDQNGFCITGNLQLELETRSASFTADPGPGEILFGWADRDVSGLVTCPAPPPNCQSVSMPDGCYDLPPAIFDEPAAPLGIRVRASALSVPIQCAMAARGGICASGEGCIDWVSATDCIAGPCTYTVDVACPTPDESLIACRRHEAP